METHLSLRDLIRDWIDSLYWFLYKLFHPRFWCYCRCYDSCWESKCRDILYKKYDDFIKWYNEYTKCITTCEKKCSEKCY